LYFWVTLGGFLSCETRFCPTAVPTSLNFAFCFSYQGRNEGGQAGTIPRVPKGPNTVTSTSIQWNCFRKTSASNMGAPNLLYVPDAI